MNEQLKIDLWVAFVRGLRVTVGLVVGVGVAYFTQQPEWIALSPVISAIGKFVREKFKIDWLPI